MAEQSISLIQTLGGLGLFLLGMIVMTDALKTLAGESIRTALMRFTKSPLTGATTGAMSTALLQSSSATTVAAVGFVGAGLMSFPAALGIVFGANLGTTITGWIVALVGFKLQLVSLMLPLILIGALARLFFRGRIASIGLAIAGFGLIFVGIDQMQLGMRGMQDMLSELHFPTDTYFDRFKLVLIGGIFTILTQSSSAGIAAVLTALFADALTLGQGLALVIGMDIGTTITAVIATLGGSVGTRRTGYSHFVYNLLTGVTAFLLLQPYLTFWEAFAPGQITANTEFILVGFHSGFNLLGVVLVLPFTRQFAALMERIVPESGNIYTAALDKVLLNEPSVALRAVSASVIAEFTTLLTYTNSLLTKNSIHMTVDLQELQNALDETHNYLDLIELGSEDHNWHQLVAFFHVLDHLQRLHERCDEDAYRAETARSSEELFEECQQLGASLEAVEQAVIERSWAKAARDAQGTSEKIRSSAEPFRDQVMHRVAADLNVAEATNLLEAIRWLRRVSYHVAQITFHLQTALGEEPSPDV